jgi:hypothetical protein
MIKNFINQFAILTAVSVSACSPTATFSEADLSDLDLLGKVDNSSALNGIQLNGIQLNGIQLNGIQLNGIQLNGIQLNGPVLLGLSYSGVTLNGQNLSDVRIDGPVLSGQRPDGKRLRGSELTGARLTGTVALGTTQIPLSFRIDRVDTALEVQRYAVSVYNGAEWGSLCGSFSDGSPIRTIALPGRWDPQTGSYVDDRNAFTFACENAAVGKCVVFGYRPWTTAEECDSYGRCREQPLSAWHQACTRMIRADYCGDGRPHTRNGTSINIWDPLGIQLREPLKGVSLEAEWTQEGAVCIQRTRWLRADTTQAETDLQYVQRVCPERLAANAKYRACSDSRSDFLTKNGLREDLDTRPLFRNESASNQ